MSTPKKEYENISAKMIEYHNSIVPFVRSIQSYGPVKISRSRTLQLRDQLEEGNHRYLKYDHNFIIEYLVLNKFILDLLDKEEYNTCLSLLNSNNQDNMILGASIIYNLVEAKKEEIKSRLNG